MKSIILLYVLTLTGLCLGQNSYIVYFKDKGANPTLEVFSEKSVQRRSMQQKTYDANDYAINKTYLNQLKELGHVKNTSRWMNAALLETNAQKEDVLALSFVDHCTLITKGKQPINKQFDNYNLGLKAVDYGIADTQVVIMNLDCLHDMGFTGEGMLIAIIDAGFNGMDTISYFSKVFSESRVVDQYDFVGDGTNVFQYSGHGTAVASCIVGEKGEPNAFGGTAIDASVALFVSEDVASESLAEEFNLVTALERADLIGADVVNISLGYTSFDNPADNHPYSDMDGHTTIAAQGANIAGAKGIMVVAAAGNEGPSTIATPCDGDSVLCVGAVSKLGNYASFSSVGPAFDGDIKPNVAAVGRRAWIIFEDGTLGMANGTSFASPITAGGVACLRQANPGASVPELFNALETTASQALTPDEFMGYGIPDFCGAYNSMVTAGINEQWSPQITLYPNPTESEITILGLNDVQDEITIRIYNNTGELVYDTTRKVVHRIELNLNSLPAGSYFLELDGKFHIIIKTQ